MPVDRQRVLHRGRELVDNDATLQSLNVRDGMVLHMVSRPVPQAQSAPPGAQQPAPGAPPPVNIPGIPGIPGIPLADLLPPQVVAAIQRGEPIGPFNFSISTQPGAGPFGGHAGPHPHVHAGVSVTVAGGPVQGGAGPFNPHQLQSRRGPPSGRMRCPFPPPQNPDEPPLTAIGGLVGMLERLEVINMEHDPHPQVPLTTRADVHNPAYAAAWTETALVFLERSWGVLSGARLNRETLAAVNRVFEAAGLRPIPLGMVPSFPLDSFSDEDVAASAEDEPAASAPETGAPSVPAAAAPGSAPQQAQPARPAASVSDSESDGPPEVSDTEVEGEDSMPSLVDSELDHRVRWDEYEEDWVTDYGESEEDDASYAMSASAEEETDSEYLEDEYGDSEDEDDLPELMSISATSEGESESATSSNGGRGPGVQGQRAFGGASAQQRRQRRRQVLQRVSEDGFILVAAVTLGELTRRYMAALDLIPAARNANALVLRTAERLRSLATLEHGRAEILVSAAYPAAQTQGTCAALVHSAEGELS